MELDQGTKRVKRLAFLLGRVGVGIMSFPRPLERFRIHGTAEPANEKQKGYVQKETSRSHSKIETPWYFHLSTNDLSVKIAVKGSDGRLEVPAGPRSLKPVFEMGHGTESARSLKPHGSFQAL